MNLFEIATRKKFRFPSQKGQLNVEQLWDLPLTSKTGPNLDDVAKTVNRELKEQAEESFVETSTNGRKLELQQMLDTVVHIIEAKQAENALARDRARRQAEKETLLEAMHNARARELMNLTPEQIQQRIAALGE